MRIELRKVSYNASLSVSGRSQHLDRPTAAGHRHRTVNGGSILRSVARMLFSRQIMLG